MASDRFIPTPAMIAAAWAVLRARWPGQPHLLGPGPGFVEAIEAAFAAMTPKDLRDALSTFGVGGEKNSTNKMERPDAAD